MDHVIEQQALDSWDSFPLFQLLNDYLRSHPSLSEGKFHKHLQEIFAPLIIRYVDLMESSIGQSIHKGMEKETWKTRGYLLFGDCTYSKTYREFSSVSLVFIFKLEDIISESNQKAFTFIKRQK